MCPLSSPHWTFTGGCLCVFCTPVLLPRHCFCLLPEPCRSHEEVIHWPLLCLINIRVKNETLRKQLWAVKADGHRLPEAALLHIYWPERQQNEPVLLYVQNFTLGPIFWCPQWHITKWNRSINNGTLFLEYIFQELQISATLTFPCLNPGCHQC